MNTYFNRITKTCAVLCALSIPALALSPATALAAPQLRVTVANDQTAPVPVTGTVNANPAPQVLNPYQTQGAIGDAATCAPQCVISFPTVPAGKRLVITNVSAQLGTSMGGFVIEGNGVVFFVPKAYPTANTLAVPVTVYFEPGSTPTARFFVQDATQHTSLVVTVVGYFVAIP
jgi:hypothetical protein